MDKLLFKRILVAALTLLALVYVAYLLISANFEMYPTENAVLATVSEKINADAFIIRDENIITNNASGILSYSVSNAEAVNAGAEIAKVFSSEEGAVSRTNAERLKKKKESLEYIQKNTISGTMSLDIINNSIKSKMITFIDDADNNKINTAKSDTDNLISSINQRLLYTGKVSNFQKEIARLDSEIASLGSASAAVSTVTTPKAGYFTEFCDGYENAFAYSDIDRLTVSDLKSMKKSDIPSNAAGKVISNVNWFVACEISADAASSLNIWDSRVTIMFSEASTEPVPAEIYRVSPVNSDGKALCVLMCDYMDDGMLEARQEPIEIRMGTYTGLRVSKRAIHDGYATKTTYDENDVPHKEEKKVQGVYVLYGSEVQFKQIRILYADNDYVICDENPPEGVLFNGETVELYDKVIVKGDDLYDGKVIK